MVPHPLPPEALHPVEQLSLEHRTILTVLDRMSEEARNVRLSFDVRIEFWLGALDWLEHFADQDHHAKEELFLFTELERAGGAGSGALRLLVSEHEDARHVRGRMVEAVASLDIAMLARTVEDYGRRLRQHMATEDHVLFPLAKRVLDPGAVARVRRGFEAHRNGLGNGQVQRMGRLAQRLVGGDRDGSVS